jgi:signal transduction histidine kinase
VGSQETSGYLITSITDTGLGIKKEKMTDLFKTFKKDIIDGNILSEGIGIGLSNAKALCKSLGGNIFVSSVEG